MAIPTVPLNSFNVNFSQFSTQFPLGFTLCEKYVKTKSNNNPWGKFIKEIVYTRIPGLPMEFRDFPGKSETFEGIPARYVEGIPYKHTPCNYLKV